MKGMNWMVQTSMILLVVGGLNWGLVGLFGFDLVDAIFGSWPGLVRLVYVLVGAAAVYSLTMTKMWMGKK